MWYTLERYKPSKLEKIVFGRQVSSDAPADHPSAGCCACLPAVCSVPAVWSCVVHRHRVLALILIRVCCRSTPSGSFVCKSPVRPPIDLAQYNTLQYNTMQCNAYPHRIHPREGVTVPPKLTGLGLGLPCAAVRHGDVAAKMGESPTTAVHKQSPSQSQRD
jgi:hypothetical protein